MSGYARPETLDEALALLHQTGGRVAAGCTDLFPATVARALEGPVVDITGLQGLRGVEATQAGLRIGAATTWSDLIKAEMPPACDMLKQAAREVGSVQIQNAATLAGNLCNASPAADGVPCLLALEAEVELAGQGGIRRMPLEAFIEGPRQTALRAGEMMTAVHLPNSALGGRSGFQKLGARRYLVISIAMVAVRIVAPAGVVEEAALAVGACSAVAVRLRQVEAALVGQAFDHTLTNAIETERVAAALSPVNDIRADATYRSHAAAELLRRALRDLVHEAQTP